MSNGYRTLSQHLNDLKKENFSLKLRIYFLEERMQQKYEASRDDIYKRVSVGGCRSHAVGAWCWTHPYSELYLVRAVRISLGSGFPLGLVTLTPGVFGQTHFTSSVSVSYFPAL